MIANPVEESIREARRLLERTTMPIDEIGFVVGYENTAFFRRLFQRTTRLHPGSYRRKFGVGQVR
jgi:transcriptional regulator GlxA family with amidase domain